VVEQQRHSPLDGAGRGVRSGLQDRLFAAKIRQVTERRYPYKMVVSIIVCKLDYTRTKMQQPRLQAKKTQRTNVICIIALFIL
jgi:hypothetical protein